MRFKDIIGESQFDGFKLVSSNQNKLREYNRFGLHIQIEPGKDLKEVNGTDVEVIIHKAKDAGPMHIVEDTSLNVEGASVGVNVRWLLDNLATLAGRKATWVVMIGVNTGDAIEVYKGEIVGTLTTPAEGTPSNGFGFDPYFVPRGSNETMAALDAKGQKDNYSARKAAIRNMLDGKAIKRVELKDIGDWTGDYQHD